METAYFNGKLVPKNEISISPDDRGFLFADGVYEVADLFPSIAGDLIRLNKLENTPSMVYLQVTRGAAKRTHTFPSPEVTPTVYAYPWGFVPDIQSKESGIKVMLKEDIRWSRCDIKSVALLPNTLSFQEAFENGMSYYRRISFQYFFRN
jgi:D-alanine transaminase